MFEVKVRKEVIKEAKKLPKAYREKLAKFLEVLRRIRFLCGNLM